MKISEKIIEKLNGLITEDDFRLADFNSLLTQLPEKKSIKIILIDFEYYNEDRLKFLQESKIECIKVQDFEEAANYRKLEKECQEYIDIRAEYDIKKSMLFFEKISLYYFYFGSSAIDEIVKESLSSHFLPRWK